MPIMGLAPAVALFVVSLVAAAFSVWWGGVIYVAGIYIADVIIVVSLISVRPPDDPTGARKIILSGDEERLFKKYYAFFRFPLGTQGILLIMRERLGLPGSLSACGRAFTGSRLPTPCSS